MSKRRLPSMSGSVRSQISGVTPADRPEEGADRVQHVLLVRLGQRGVALRMAARRVEGDFSQATVGEVQVDRLGLVVLVQRCLYSSGASRSPPTSPTAAADVFSVGEKAREPRDAAGELDRIAAVGEFGLKRGACRPESRVRSPNIRCGACRRKRCRQRSRGDKERASKSSARRRFIRMYTLPPGADGYGALGRNCGLSGRSGPRGGA